MSRKRFSPGDRVWVEVDPPMPATIVRADRRGFYQVTYDKISPGGAQLVGLVGSEALNRIIDGAAAELRLF